MLRSEGIRVRPFPLRKVFIVAVSAAVAAGAVVAVSGPAQAASLGDQLASGDGLAPGDSLDSAGDTYHLVMQADGDLVESGADGQPVWQTSTSSPGASLLNAADGNLAVQAADGTVVWSTSYDPARGPATLTVNDQGTLIDQADSGSVLWVNYATPGGALTRADGAVEFAHEQLGKPYGYGAAGPNSFDSSGLTMAAWAVVGVPLPHNGPAQIAATTPVDRSELQAGDLVFYGTGTLVAVYIGNDQIILAPHTGARVQLAGLDYQPILSFGRVA
jgi:cell wall-associated NlpC family hydrolase